MGIKGKIFEYAIFGGFLAMFVIGVGFFSTMNKGKNQVFTTPVTIWGSYAQDRYRSMIDTTNEKIGGLDKVSYVEKPASSIYADLVEAIASGTGPDIVVIKAEDLMPLLNKVFPISYQTYPQRQFLDTFIDGATAFALPDAIYAIPYTVDPLVMYWNKDILSSAGVTLVPKTWSEFVALIPRLTKIEGGAVITQSAVALGEYENVLHAKEILSTLLFQAGSSIVEHNGTGFVSTLLTKNDTSSAAALALRFYTDFSNPSRAVYSWNRAQQRSRESFLAGTLAFYFGPASEVDSLRQANPNLNFDVAVVPQSSTRTRRVTYGDISALTVLRTSRDPARSLEVVNVLTSPTALTDLMDAVGLPPIRRDMLQTGATNATDAIFYESAIIAQTWLEPSATAVDDIFGRMVSEVTGGRRSIGESVDLANRELGSLLPRTQAEATGRLPQIPQ